MRSGAVWTLTHPEKISHLNVFICYSYRHLAKLTPKYLGVRIFNILFSQQKIITTIVKKKWGQTCCQTKKRSPGKTSIWVEGCGCIHWVYPPPSDHVDIRLVMTMVVGGGTTQSIQVGECTGTVYFLFQTASTTSTGLWIAYILQVFQTLETWFHHHPHHPNPLPPSSWSVQFALSEWEWLRLQFLSKDVIYHLC